MDAEALAVRVMNAMEEPLEIDGEYVIVSLSTGVSLGSRGDSAVAVLAAASAVLHEAKRRGPRQWRCASGLETDAARRRLDIVHGLQNAVAAGEIVAHFQPIVALASGSVVGFEALARWKRSDGSQVSPAQFIAVAESTGLISALGRSVLGQACDLLASLYAAQAKSSYFVTVNVSPHQLREDCLPGCIEDVLDRWEFPRKSLYLELTESALVPDDAAMIAQLQNLKRLGLRLAIDDFGTGYSSLAYLTQFPIDLLKLDRAFITSLQKDSRRLAVAKAVISLARELDIAVLAEGVETAAERDILQDLACELGQGFLWSHALSADQARALTGSGPLSAQTIVQPRLQTPQLVVPSRGVS